MLIIIDVSPIFKKRFYYGNVKNDVSGCSAVVNPVIYKNNSINTRPI